VQSGSIRDHWKQSSAIRLDQGPLEAIKCNQ